MFIMFMQRYPPHTCIRVRHMQHSTYSICAELGLRQLFNVPTTRQCDNVLRLMWRALKNEKMFAPRSPNWVPMQYLAALWVVTGVILSVPSSGLPYGMKLQYSHFMSSHQMSNSISCAGLVTLMLFGQWFWFIPFDFSLEVSLLRRLWTWRFIPA